MACQVLTGFSKHGRSCRPLFVYPSSVVDCGPFDGLPSPDRFSKAGTVLSSLLILSTLCREPRSRCAITKSYLRTVRKSGTVLSSLLILSTLCREPRSLRWLAKFHHRVLKPGTVRSTPLRLSPPVVDCVPFAGLPSPTTGRYENQGRSWQPCSSYPPSVVNRGPVVLLPSPTSGRYENQGQCGRRGSSYP